MSLSWLDTLPSLPWLAASALAGVALLQLMRLAIADADLSLLAKGPAPNDAFKGKVVWLTGASQGLGEELALYFARHGARLILSARNLEKLEMVRQACLSHGALEAKVLQLDLSRKEYSVFEDAAAVAAAAFGGSGVDLLVHNAGGSQHSLAEETSATVAEELFALNTLGPIHLTRALLPHLLLRAASAPGGGGRGSSGGSSRIVVVASAAAKVPAPGQALYSACKVALWGYFATLATELAARGVRVTLCYPGPLGTGTQESPRNVWGATGKLEQQQATSAAKGKRMSPARAAELIGRAAAHGVDEAWISRQPVLLMFYVMQYLPSVGLAFMKYIGAVRAKAVHSGRSGYDIGETLKASRRA